MGGVRRAVVVPDAGPGAGGDLSDDIAEGGPHLPPAFFKAAQALYVDGMTTEVVTALAATGIPPIVLKGPSIARWLYPAGGRTYADSDLLVPSSQFAEAEQVLRSLGFTSTVDGFDPFEHGPRNVETPFHRSRIPGVRSGGKVDLHRNLPYLPVPDDVLWDVLDGECETMRLGSVDVRVLNRSGVALHIIVHAVQHGFGSHTDEDLRRLIASLGREEWPRVGALARRLDIDGVVGLGLRHHAEGAEIADRLGLGDAVPTYSSYFWNTARAPRGTASLLKLAAAPTVHDKMRVLRWALVPAPTKVRPPPDHRGRSLVLGYVRHWQGLVKSFVPAARFVARCRNRRHTP